MSDRDYEIAIPILRAIQNDIAEIKLIVRDTSATIDRILAMPLPSGPAHA